MSAFGLLSFISGLSQGFTLFLWSFFFESLLAQLVGWFSPCSHLVLTNLWKHPGTRIRTWWSADDSDRVAVYKLRERWYIRYLSKGHIIPWQKTVYASNLLGKGDIWRQERGPSHSRVTGAVVLCDDRRSPAIMWKSKEGGLFALRAGIRPKTFPEVNSPYLFFWTGGNFWASPM